MRPVCRWKEGAGWNGCSWRWVRREFQERLSREKGPLYCGVWWVAHPAFKKFCYPHFDNHPSQTSTSPPNLSSDPRLLRLQALVKSQQEINTLFIILRLQTERECWLASHLLHFTCAGHLLAEPHIGCKMILNKLMPKIWKN